MRTPPARLTGVAFSALAVLAVAGVTQAPVANADRSTREDAAVAAAQEHRTATRFGADQALVPVETIVDGDGTTHVRMHRTYRGLEVVGGDLVAHRSGKGAWKGSSQTLRSDLTLSTTPTVSAASAETAALVPSAANRGIKDLAAGGTTLVVDATGDSARLAYRVLTTGVQEDGTPSRLATFVDARSGAVLRAVEQIQTADGSGQSLYGGTVPLQLTLSGATYQLKDPTRGNTFTTDMNGAVDSKACQRFGRRCDPGVLFTSADNLFGNGTTGSRESAAVDAQYGTNMTWDFYKEMFGRHGIFGNGTGSSNRVHYGSGYANAFWDGARMTYGDGDGVDFGPLTSLDVAGHEMSHGVTGNTANLTYAGESGGLNEATSDIFGTMVEFFAANPNDPADYLIGEQFDLQDHLGFRRMDNPSADGKSVNCWSAGVGNLNVHYSSGVGNHFFYLLAEGSGAKTINGVAHNSPTCNGSTVSGIGRDAASRIWYRALTVYMTSSTSYAGARTATLNAAKDLFGATSTQYAAVGAAWSAVSVS